MIVDSNILSTYNLVLILNVKVLALYSDAYMVLARIVLAVSLLIVLITVVGCCGIRLLYIVCNLYVWRRLSKMDRIFKRRDRTMKPVTSSSLTLSKERKICIFYYGYLRNLYFYLFYFEVERAMAWCSCTQPSAALWSSFSSQVKNLYLGLFINEYFSNWFKS